MLSIIYSLDKKQLARISKLFFTYSMIHRIRSHSKISTEGNNRGFANRKN